MKGNVVDLIPVGVVIEKSDIVHLFFRLCRQSEYQTPPSVLREVVNEIVDHLDEDGYWLSVEIEEIPKGAD